MGCALGKFKKKKTYSEKTPLCISIASYTTHHIPNTLQTPPWSLVRHRGLQTVGAGSRSPAYKAPGTVLRRSRHPNLSLHAQEAASPSGAPAAVASVAHGQVLAGLGPLRAASDSELCADVPMSPTAVATAGSGSVARPLPPCAAASEAGWPPEARQRCGAGAYLHPPCTRPAPVLHPLWEGGVVSEASR